MNPHDITLFIYNLSLFPVIIFSVLFLLLTLMCLFITAKPVRRISGFSNPELPFVSVQIPTFNDPIAKRCIEHCLSFDYPKEKFEIIIADDSTNPETQAMLSGFAVRHPGFVKYIHRDNRSGFKPGALKNAMKITRGEIIVIFDSDWMPPKDFLRQVVAPFHDPQVALVQTRQGFYNKDANIITRFSAYLLMVYHTIIMPINNKINCVFFCGTAGALRRSAVEKVGGWNATSVTEDADMTVNLLLHGYKTVYLDFETPSELPDTFEAFIKQQMRWCYGNVRVFFDHGTKILFKKGLTIKQRMMILYVTLGNIAAPIVILMTIFGFLGWFSGEPALFTFQDILTMAVRVLYTGGFLLMGIITLYKHEQLSELPYLVWSIVTVGIILAVANSFAFFKAALNKQLNWFCTPKTANKNIFEK